jgi:hypothetical protein
LDITLGLCDTLCGIIDNTSHEPYRTECARAADSIFFESVSPDYLPRQEPLNAHPQSRGLAEAISSVLADDQVLPTDGSVPLQTVLMALVWSALSFATESLPADQARAWVRGRIMGSAPSRPHH